MNLNAITAILQAANVGVLGRTLFNDHMPDTVLTGCMVRLPTEGIPLSGYTPGYFRAGKVQAIVRSPDYDTGRLLADKVIAALTITLKTDCKDASGRLLVTINRMRALTLPVVYARTPGNLTEWSINFEANYVMPGF